MDRSHLEAEQVAKEEEKLRQECTFNPELTTAKIAAHFLQQKLQKHRQHQNDNDNNSNSIRDESREVVIIQRWGNYTIPRGRSRYRQAAAAVAAAAAASGGGGGGMWGGDRRVTGVGRGRDWELERCTFKPVVIGARKGMQQAQQYLQVRFEVIVFLGNSRIIQVMGYQNVVLQIPALSVVDIFYRIGISCTHIQCGCSTAIYSQLYFMDCR